MKKKNSHFFTLNKDFKWGHFVKCKSHIQLSFYVGTLVNHTNIAMVVSLNFSELR